MNNEDIESLSSKEFQREMRDMRAKTNVNDLLNNWSGFKDREEKFELALELAESMTDRKMLNMMLFTIAEYLDTQKPLRPDIDLHTMQAKAIDWVRHVLDEKPEALRDAVQAVHDVVTGAGAFDDARRGFAKVNVRKDEFDALYDYWYNALLGPDAIIED